MVLRSPCRPLLLLAAFFACLIASVLPVKAQDEQVTVFAAASLKNAIDDINAAWAANSDKKAVASFAASSALARQIEAGAPADVFISADLKWMDYLEKAEAIKPATRINLLGNRIVLVAPKGAAETVSIEPGFPLAGLIGDGKLAMGNTDSVPAGVYGKAALVSLGVWDDISGRIAQAENVRAALLLVSRGEAPFGIVYSTDAASDLSVAIAGTFPESSHPPIIYPAAVTAVSKSTDAEAYLAFLGSEKAAAIFRKHGFAVLTPQAN